MPTWRARSAWVRPRRSRSVAMRSGVSPCGCAASTTGGGAGCSPIPAARSSAWYSSQGSTAYSGCPSRVIICTFIDTSPAAKTTGPSAATSYQPGSATTSAERTSGRRTRPDLRLVGQPLQLPAPRLGLGVAPGDKGIQLAAPGAHEPGQHGHVVEQAHAQQEIGNQVQRREEIRQTGHHAEQRLAADRTVFAAPPGQAQGLQQRQAFPQATLAGGPPRRLAGHGQQQRRQALAAQDPGGNGQEAGQVPGRVHADLRSTKCKAAMKGYTGAGCSAAPPVPGSPAQTRDAGTGFRPLKRQRPVGTGRCAERTYLPLMPSSSSSKTRTELGGISGLGLWSP